jgi:exodeoxyribonuclease VII small subunit
METLTYKEAKQELNRIISEIESGTADIDSLSEKIRRAGELITFCRNKLRETEKDVNTILNLINDDEKQDNPTDE